MRGVLALASLRRHSARTALAILGVAVAAAMLLDMVMLSSGMRESFRELLLSRGFQLRLAPRGTLPFDTDATIAGASEISQLLRSDPAVERASPVLGASVRVIASGVTSFAIGVDPARQGDYELLAGSDIYASDRFVANDDFFRATGARIGDTLQVAGGYDPQVRSYAGQRRLVLTGRARFLYTSTNQIAIAMPLATLQAMAGADRVDRVSLFMIRVRQGEDVDAVGARIAARIPRVSAISTASALAQVDQRLSYFRQLAFILGAVSLVVGFLLVTTLVTVSVNERIGEIGVMRAMGVSTLHVVQQIVLEGVVISLAGAVAGLGLGLVTARYLNAILSDFPGLPTAIDFFLFQPAAAWTALALLTASGILAGVYPAWRAATLPIAATLRREAIA